MEVRHRIVSVAQGWVGTPYHPGARKKGVGCDCLTLLAGIYEEAGCLPAVPIPYYPQDWHLHRGEERYQQGLLQYAREFSGPPEPGDIVLWKFGRCFSHGAIVVDWPRIIHATLKRGCIEENAEAAHWLSGYGKHDGHAQLASRPVKYFSIF